MEADSLITTLQSLYFDSFHTENNGNHIYGRVSYIEHSDQVLVDTYSVYNDGRTIINCWNFTREGADEFIRCIQEAFNDRHS